ncbi:hypothetical protein V9T40_006866 [Parthenolecanium corni]|uniref:Tropomyosin n=1 Tax=Parthenolecanium corni TaxID=536013 RepID=A0AAN9TS56_9HEMI
MDAIKKKMQAMKLEKDNAMDRALLCEQQARDANLRAEKAEEEARALQKKIQTIENELDQTQEQLMQVNAKLEEKNKALQTNTFPSLLTVSAVTDRTGGQPGESRCAFCPTTKVAHHQLGAPQPQILAP